MNDEKEYRLSKLEQETIIIFNEEEDDATIGNLQPPLNQATGSAVPKTQKLLRDREVGIWGKHFIVPKSILTS